MSNFTAVVTALVDPETGERGQLMSKTFENFVEAEKAAINECIGVALADYIITAELPLKRAVTTVLASRNKLIGLYLCQPNNKEAIPAYLHLKAPLTVAALEAVYAGDNGAARIPFRITRHCMHIG